MSDRRAFLSSLAGASLVLPAFRPQAFRHLANATAGAGNRSAALLADDEDYWGEIQRAFDNDRTLINLNNGGCSPTPTHVLEQMIRDLRFSNELPVDHMWRVLEPRVESVRRDLAREFGCDPEEMAITRNASEANEIMIFGLDLKKGDEVVSTNQNYGRMLTAWDQRVRREGIVLKQISFPLPPRNQQEIVDRFKEAVTPRTKVIEVTHITNLSGHIMPVKELVAFARPLGIEVFVDGALQAGGTAPVRVSAWARENGLVLGQLKVRAKSNEITAVPELLRALELAGCIVTLDAMGCQKNIAKEIKEADAKYVLALKGNQGTVHQEVQSYLDDAITRGAKELIHWETVEKDHGRLDEA